MKVYNPNPEKMIIYLRGCFRSPEFEQSRAALAFAIEAHEGQMRKDGVTPYIVHPLSMACDAIACVGATDEIIATILLHDVCEDCKIPLAALPGNDIVKRGVELMTIDPLPGEDKPATKRRYFNELLKSREAIICKAFDRYANLNDAEGVLDEEAIVKNIRETHDLLMPALKKAKSKYTELSDMLHAIRSKLKDTINMMAHYHHIEFTDSANSLTSTKPSQ